MRGRLDCSNGRLSASIVNESHGPPRSSTRVGGGGLGPFTPTLGASLSDKKGRDDMLVLRLQAELRLESYIESLYMGSCVLCFCARGVPKDSKRQDLFRITQNGHNPGVCQKYSKRQRGHV